MAALLSSKPPADGDEEKDEGGFGASVAMSEFRLASRVFLVWRFVCRHAVLPVLPVDFLKARPRVVGHGLG